MLKPDEVHDEIERAAENGYLQDCKDQLFLRCLCMLGARLDDMSDEIERATRQLEQIATELGGLSEPISNHSVTVHKL